MGQLITRAIGGNGIAERAENDYYATDPIAAEWLVKLIDLHSNIWECAAGEKALSNVFEQHGYNVRSSDLIKRREDIEELDFLKAEDKWDGDIVTNPPYKYAEDFIRKGLSLVDDGKYVCMFLKMQFVEGKRKRKMFDEFPPKYIFVSSSRINCARNGEFANYPKNGAICYCWYVWEKGFKGDTILRWFN